MSRSSLENHGTKQVIFAPDTLKWIIMKHNQGFSLLETLIALCLISSSSLALLNLQWQLIRTLNQCWLHSLTAIDQENNYEQSLP